jgi:hypothetical protein
MQDKHTDLESGYDLEVKTGGQILFRGENN